MVAHLHAALAAIILVLFEIVALASADSEIFLWADCSCHLDVHGLGGARYGSVSLGDASTGASASVSIRAGAVGCISRNFLGAFLVKVVASFDIAEFSLMMAFPRKSDGDGFGLCYRS